MTPQLVDLNADGYQDMVMGTFEGTVFLVAGSKEGFLEPTQILDKNDELVRISMYWDLEEEKYMYVDRTVDDETYHKKHHLTSSTVVDWDEDGDFDLILGAYEGALYVCLNEGSSTEPKFSDTNFRIKSAGQPLTLEEGLATPIVRDWNQDGLFDLICGGSKGGVFYFENRGQPGTPEFGSPIKLIDKIRAVNSGGKNSRAFVPTIDGKPFGPGTGFHIDVVDYDGDGDLDLLVGGQSLFQREEKVLTSDEEAELAGVNEQIEEARNEISSLTLGKSAEEIKAVYKTPEFMKHSARLSELYRSSQKIKPTPRPANHVWLFRNQGNQSATLTSAPLEKTAN